MLRKNSRPVKQTNVLTSVLVTSPKTIETNANLSYFPTKDPLAARKGLKKHREKYSSDLPKMSYCRKFPTTLNVLFFTPIAHPMIRGEIDVPNIPFDSRRLCGKAIEAANDDGRLITAIYT